MRISIRNNKVYLIRFLFFKLKIGTYADGIIVIENQAIIKKLKKDNKDKNLRKSF